MTAPNNNAPTWQGRGVGSVVSGQSRQANHSPVDTFMQRLPKPPRQSGKGWRADCPACDDRKQALSFTEGDGEKLILHCFKGCAAVDVLAALGLRLADVYPFRNWPESPQKKRAARRAIREAGFRAALSTLAVEWNVVQAAARQLARWGVLSEEDDARLALALHRFDGAKGVFCE